MKIFITLGFLVLTSIAQAKSVNTSMCFSPAGSSELEMQEALGRAILTKINECKSNFSIEDLELKKIDNLKIGLNADYDGKPAEGMGCIWLKCISK